MPTIFMLIGVPASGKSTWVASLDNHNSVILSTDSYIEDRALLMGLTYDKMFVPEIKNAENHMWSCLKNAISSNLDIIWDQTNLTMKSRANKLAGIPSHYKKVAVVFPTPDDLEHNRRLNSRPGKTIPEHIMNNMKQNFQQPTIKEGFDEIIYV